MRIAFHQPYDPLFEQASLGLRVILQINNWQKQCCALALRYFDASAKTTEGMLRALHTARGWSEYADATKYDVSDYTAQANSFVSKVAQLAFSEQSVFVSLTDDALQRWHTACLGNLAPIAEAGEFRTSRSWPSRSTLGCAVHDQMNESNRRSG